MLKNTELEIRRIANGFMVAPSTNGGKAIMNTDIYVFEAAVDLAGWLEKWGREQEQKDKDAKAAQEKKA